MYNLKIQAVSFFEVNINKRLIKCKRYLIKITVPAECLSFFPAVLSEGQHPVRTELRTLVWF